MMLRHRLTPVPLLSHHLSLIGGVMRTENSCASRRFETAGVSHRAGAVGCRTAAILVCVDYFRLLHLQQICSKISPLS
jgi:hypothetical protein